MAHTSFQQRRCQACALPYMFQQAYHAAHHEHSCYNMIHNLVKAIKEMSNTSSAQRKPLATCQVLIRLLLCMHVNSAHPMTVAQ